MIKIYTEKAWLSYFNRYPCIVIEADGLIYEEERLYKWLVSPIGKVDFSKGEIYGADYNKRFASPVGYLKQNGTVIELYGEDYRRKMIRFPIGYIEDNKYYSYEEYHRFFRTPSMYIEQET